MNLRDCYYVVKPLIPRGLQLALRRQLVLRKRKQCADVWPILESAGRPPKGWKGWPDGKQFAFVLTHDVDTAKGHDNCLGLAELEESYGFCSSFNFVPERYEVLSQVRDELLKKGFEVGIHGLVHDGKLFSSRKIFEERAGRINKYLQDWGCCGFRSPAMHHNLEWICELNVQYDASTFDTDPFEPQSDGVGTIFPFVLYRNTGQPLRTADSRRPFDFAQGLEGLERQTADRRIPQTPALKAQNQESVSSASQHPESRTQHQELHPPWAGAAPSAQNPMSLAPSTLHQKRSFYVELPYTLPQDHCLFVIMGEKGIDIWKKKLDWIAEKGGMALLNTHPDYMNCRGGGCGLEEYPIRFYEEFLNYVKDKYEGQYWHVIPKEMARFWREKMVHRS